MILEITYYESGATYSVGHGTHAELMYLAVVRWSLNDDQAKSLSQRGTCALPGGWLSLRNERPK
jgi:hypothetical protein